MYSETVNKLINQFEKLPGIGHKTAVRLAFYILASLGDIAIILLIFIALITNIFYYKIIFIKSNSDALKKMGCLPDVIFLLTKISN